MFNNTILYNLFQNATSYQIIFGGTILPLDYLNGSLIITLINSSVLSNSNLKSKIVDTMDKSYLEQYSLIQNNYQIDLYKINPLNIDFIDCNFEAQKVREYLKSLDAQEYLKSFDIEALACFSNINFVSEYNENKHLVNRAFFDFSVVYKERRLQEISKIGKIEITKNLIIGGKNE